MPEESVLLHLGRTAAATASSFTCGAACVPIRGGLAPGWYALLNATWLGPYWLLMSSHPPAFSKAFVIPLGVLVALILVGLQGRGRALPGSGETRAFANVAPLSVQSCIAECQDQFTECTLRCDQDGECVRGCQAEVAKCVRTCRGEKGAEPKPDAGAEPPPTP